MARRSAPPNSGPAYYSRSAVTHAGLEGIDGVERSVLSKFMHNEIWAPEKLSGNFAILTGVAVFAAGIAVVRTWGEMLIP